MNLKKIIISTVIIIALFHINTNQLNSADCKITEIHYRAYLDTKNPVWLFLYYLCFSSQDFILKEKRAENNEKGDFNEVIITNSDKEIAMIFSANGVFGGKTNFCEYWTTTFNSEQAKFWFEVWDFIRSAEPKFPYLGNYQGAKDIYTISVKAIRKELVETSTGYYQALYFKGMAWKESGKHIEMKFWLAKGGEEHGRIVKGIIKKDPWPAIIVEIQ